jgi:2-C-methyl-D-erythritol 2,4-cyclodiphosphate synthase
MIGFGYDSHRLAEGESLILGGVKITSDFGTVAHSDGDAVYHSLCDALLGAAALGDIGEHFPDTNIAYKNIDSSLLTEHVIELIEKKGLKIVNIDISIILEKPRLSSYKTEMKNNISSICHISSDKVNIKPKTNEKMGFIGSGEGIAVFCVCQLESTQS